MRRIVLVLPTSTYRAPDFLEAAGRLGCEIVVASERRQALADEMGERAVRIDLDDPDGAAGRLVEAAERVPVDAIVPVDDQGVLVAARAAARLGLPHNPPEAVALTRDKGGLRRALAEAGLEQPPFRDAGPEADVGALAAEVGFPCVVKARSLAASRGVIRADTPEEASAAAERVRAILRDAGHDPSEPLVVEGYVPGAEVAVEGLLRDGRLEVLAVFDKPDPLEGPYFEETVYVTPSRLPEGVAERVREVTAEALDAVGLREGPVHAELRLPGVEPGRLSDAPADVRPVLLEVAARSIGGLCARSLTFGLGMSLEEVILRHALGRPLGRFPRERSASGVMMLPIPRAGTLRGVRGREEARAVPGVVGLEITAPLGHPIRPLPEGDRYLGFLFARAEEPEAVERALREGFGRLEIDIDDPR